MTLTNREQERTKEKAAMMKKKAEFTKDEVLVEQATTSESGPRTSRLAKTRRRR